MTFDELKVVYARERVAHIVDHDVPSIFLAGPTPRSNEVTSWRPEAISILKVLDFRGYVFVPENRNNAPFDDSYRDEQVDWEWDHLELASAIAFWVPRNMQTLPGLTTNVEFGLYVRDRRSVFGHPPDAEHVAYLRRVAKRFEAPIFDTLENTMWGATLRACAYY